MSAQTEQADLEGNDRIEPKQAMLLAALLFASTFLIGLAIVITSVGEEMFRDGKWVGRQMTIGTRTSFHLQTCAQLLQEDGVDTAPWRNWCADALETLLDEME